MNMLQIHPAESAADKRTARVAERLGVRNKPARLVQAEQDAATLRRDHAIASATRTSLIQERFALGERAGSAKEAEIRSADRALAKAAQALKDASLRLEAERRLFAPDHLRALAGPSAEAKALVIELLTALDELAAAARDAHNFCAINSLDMPSWFISLAPVLQSHVRDIRHVITE